MIIDHDHPAYRKKFEEIGKARYNGAFYYSKEIAKNIIPNVKTDRNWITVNIEGVGCDHSIFFVHNNLRPQNYEWLKQYKDIILVCGIEETCEKVAHLGTPIYIPLSIDVEYVKQYKLPKEKRTKGAAYVGRKAKRIYPEMCETLPDGIDMLEGIKRQALLPLMAEYDTIYAVGRTAIEAKCLGCKLKAYDPRYPKVSVWKVLDNHEAAKMLQEKLDEIDGK